jgi:hypothetical protein
MSPGVKVDGRGTACGLCRKEEEAQRVVAREGWERHPERKSDVGIRHKVMRSLKINVGDDVFNALTST